MNTGNSSQSPFSSLLKSLKPLSTTPYKQDAERDLRPRFCITILNNVPHLMIQDIPAVVNSLSASEENLYCEIKRLAQSGMAFGLWDYQPDNRISIPLHNYPYLNLLIADGCRVAAPDGALLTFVDTDSTPVLQLSDEERKSEMRADICINIGGEYQQVDAFLDDRFIMCGSTVYHIKSVGNNFAHIKDMAQGVTRESLPAFLTLFLSYVDNILPELNGTTARRSSHTEKAQPTLYLEKVAADRALYMRTGLWIESLNVDQLPPEVSPRAVVRIDPDDTIVIYNVESCDIDDLTDRLESLILSSAPNRTAKREIYRDDRFFIIPEETAGPFLFNHLPEVLETFRMVGSERLKEYKVVATQPKLNLKLSSGIDFLDTVGTVAIGSDTFTLADLIKQYSTQKYIKLSDGNRGIIDEKYMQRLERLYRRRDKEGKIRITIFDLPDVEELIEKKITGPFAAKSRSLLEGFNKLKKAAKPKCDIQAKLRPYQEQGIKWLKYLYDNNLGGCLADDMGLGKTVQTIALLSMVYPAAESPTLIVMPRSLLFNWEKELAKFAPQLTFATYYGPGRNFEKAMEANIVLTTYAIVRNDIEQFRSAKFDTIILDESQNIKNIGAQTTASIWLLNAPHRFALSGTPMENNLTELYSLFRFLNPTMLGSIDDFNASYTYPIQKNGSEDATENLRRKISPFILRRLKKNVLKDLPERIDQTIYVEMSDRQKRLYEERRLSFRRQIDEAIARDGVDKAQFIMFQALNELRRIASVPESISDNRVESPKIAELTESLMSAAENGHKSVVFFNFLSGLELISERLEKLGIPFEAMTGSTSAAARKRAVERFQSDPECMVMLMTLKVGGVGLNLTAADTVYIFEPWWNKAAEEQAINRLHRIGQKKTVSAFSIIAVDTIEEKMLQLQAQKSELFNSLINADTASSKHLSEQDINFILS